MCISLVLETRGASTARAILIRARGILETLYLPLCVLIKSFSASLFSEPAHTLVARVVHALRVCARARG